MMEVCTESLNAALGHELPRCPMDEKASAMSDPARCPRSYVPSMSPRGHVQGWLLCILEGWFAALEGSTASWIDVMQHLKAV